MDKINILLIDDDQNLLLYYKKILNEKIGDFININNCVTSTQINSYLTKVDYDIILLDQKLENGVKGIELISQIKKVSPNSYIIMNTAYGGEKIAVNAFRNGVDDYIENDKDDDVALISAISRAIEKKKEIKKDISEIKNSIDVFIKKINKIEEKCKNKEELIKSYLL